MGKVKVERVKKRIKIEASQIIQRELSDPRMGFVTVTKVELTEDFKFASIYVSILADGPEQRNTMRALEHARGFIQSEIARRLRTKQTPRITIKFDPSIEGSIRISQLIDRALGKSDENQGLAEEDEEE